MLYLDHNDERKETWTQKATYNASKSSIIRKKTKTERHGRKKKCRLEEVRIRGYSWRSEVTPTRQVA